MAIVIRKRLGGKLIMVSSAYSFLPHFMVKKKNKYIDFTCCDINEPRLLWFQGRIRKMKFGWKPKKETIIY